MAKYLGMTRTSVPFPGLALALFLFLGGCAQGPAPVTSTPAATTSGDKAMDSVAATYRATEEKHSLIEAQRVEKDTGIVEEALDE